MLIVLGDQQKSDLALLGDFDDNVSREFCKIAVGFIRNGINAKMYQTAGSKLNIDSQTVRKCVEALMHLMTETSKSLIGEIDFQDSMLTVGFSESLTSTLLTLYLEHRGEIRNVLKSLSFGLPSYNDLQWRFDVEVASRALHYQTKPVITLKLDLKDGNDDIHRVIQTDPVNLVHMTEELEKALAEMKTSHCRRITRNIK
eukprot:gene12284-13549_t